MSTPPILLIKRGSVSANDIALARKAGVLVIVVKDPGDVRYMHPPILPVSRFQAVATEMVRATMSERYGKLDHEGIRERLFRVFMEDTRPQPIEPIVTEVLPDKASPIPATRKADLP